MDHEKNNKKKEQAISLPYVGLKSSSRIIAAQDSVQDKTRFLIGSAVIGKQNQIQIIEYDEMCNSVSCVQCLDHDDELWWISCHQTDEDLVLTTSFNPVKQTTKASVYKIPEPNELQERQKMELAGEVEVEDNPKRSLFIPGTDNILVSGRKYVSIYDINNLETPIVMHDFSEFGRVNCAVTDPLHDNNAAICVGSSIILWDYGSDSITKKLDDAHRPNVLDMAYNDSKSFWICSGGSDGKLKCWDTRDEKCSCEFKASSHWVTRTIPNPSHEQLILTAGTDSKVRIFNSSHFAFENDGGLDDGEIIKSIRHDDSVYSAAWSANNNWIFASVSYKGQVNISQVPTDIQDRILMNAHTDI